MTTRLVFGEADPNDYMEPLCADCKHIYSEHYDGNGTPGGPMAPCWLGWTGDVDGCDCLRFRAAGEPRLDPVEATE